MIVKKNTSNIDKLIVRYGDDEDFEGGYGYNPRMEQQHYTNPGPQN